MEKSIITFTKTWHFDKESIIRIINDYNIDLSQDIDEIEDEISDIINSMDNYDLDDCGINDLMDNDMDIRYKEFEALVAEIKEDEQ